MKAANFMAPLKIALIDYQLFKRPIPVFIKKSAVLVQADDLCYERPWQIFGT